MFARFKLNLDMNDLRLHKEFDRYKNNQFKKINKIVHSSLDKYLIIDGSLDASEIENDWFPNVDAHIFLSHSHEDEQAVICFAGFLYENYGIKSFIDSTVCGYANEILNQIDKEYCVKEEKKGGGYTYDYDKRNQSTAHVHMLLQGALAKMINKCECLMVVNTPASLKVSEIGKETTTSSPWIYSELLMANTFPRRNLEDHNTAVSNESFSVSENFDLKINYKVGLEKFVDINLNEIIESANKVNKKDARSVLDRLYVDKGILLKNN